jgi:dGTPase
MCKRADRRHANEHDEGQRTPWQRDRDAILYSSAFRRLAGVTQVVSPDGSQVYHNRLTHTLEVAQIAQRIAQYFNAVFPQECEDLGGVDPDVVETAALAHDLGHPPFGHIAEKELNKALVNKGLVCGYEGNAQSFRILTKLALRREDTRGLNLTRASLNATLKYPWLQEEDQGQSVANSDQPAKRQKHKKWGFYQSEADDFAFARAAFDDGGRSRSVEAQIMDWADDIAYSIHDTEDFYRAGLIPLGHLATNVNAVNTIVEEVLSQEIDIQTHSTTDLAETFRQLCGSLPFSGPYEPTRDQRAMLRGFTSDFIGRYVMGTKLRDKSNQEGSFLEIDGEIKMQVFMLKKLTWHFVIKGRSLAGVQHGQRHALETLFAIFANATANESDWAILPTRNRDELDCLKREHGSDLST